MRLTKVDQILKQTPIRTRLFIHLQMSDYDNWDNGEYKGDNKKIKETVNHLIDRFKDFLSDGCYEGFKKFDLKK